MPATEQTWRNIKKLHVLFGVSGLAMFLATLWMLGADHAREWRKYQRDFVRVSTASAKWREQELETAQFKATSDQLSKEVAAAQAVLPEEADVQAFVVELVQFRRFQAKEIPEAEWENPPSYDEIQSFDDTGIMARYAELRDRFASTEDEQARRDARNRFVRGGNITGGGLTDYIDKARMQEAFLATEKKNENADLAVYVSRVDLAVRDEVPEEQIAALQKAVDDQRQKVAELDQRLQDAASNRKNLEAILARMVAQETAAVKAQSDHLADLKQRTTAVTEQSWSLVKSLTELPIVDGFSPALKIDQIWLPDLTIDLNFRRVARFDRCITCHRATELTAPGSAVDPAYQHEHLVELALSTPDEAPSLEDAAADRGAANTPSKSLSDEEQEKENERRLDAVYGIGLASAGVLSPTDVTVNIVRPESLGALAGLRPGDVIYKIANGRILSKKQAVAFLLEGVQWGEPVGLTVRRGMPHPFSSHPRLDLFVGSTSPHKQGDFGCTICHAGQGSATAFKWASHTPNTPVQRTLWRREHGWFDNHHWIFPMYPERFIESGCLKCHHNVTELEPSERFPDPPAPKLVQGFNLIREYGCFGCHEINGYSGPETRIGPDLRLEPQVASAAAALLADPGLSEQEVAWATQLVQTPDDDAVRRRLEEAVSEDAAIAARDRETPRLSRDSHAMTELLKDAESPGQFRKVGPSLRYVSSKLDERFLHSWLANPTNFRPDTRMPRFFGLHDHLSEEEKPRTQVLENAEILAISHYLLVKSQPFSYIEKPAEVTVEPSRERGQLLFETRCLACHKHSDFPEATATFGPDLSRLGAKLLGQPANNEGYENDKGAQWLYTWLRNPEAYHARTFMPDMKLAPRREADGVVTDPAADIAAFLLSFFDWEAEPSAIVLEQQKSTPEFQQAVDSLAHDYLISVYTRRAAEEILRRGIPTTQAANVRGAEVELLGDGMTLDKKLAYLGRRTISKYGCFGCHDIPGFETAKPIGTTLADWGKKDSSLLAFEHVGEYLAEKMGSGHGGGHAHVEPSDMDPDTGFFVQAIQSHHREGFLWQKLRDPRGYDYQKTETKGYHERLRMPKFNFTQDEIESIMTFILGLVADPPSAEYVYEPTPQRGAELAGTRVLQKFNCAGCHTMRMERWEFDYLPGDVVAQEPLPDYPFLQPHFTPDEVRRSEAVDLRGLGHASVYGRADINDQGKTQFYDEEFSPLTDEDLASGDVTPYYQVEIWRPTLINGQPKVIGDKTPLISKQRLTQRYPAWGGYLPNLVYARVLELERQFNAQANPAEVWGWLPPPLVGEGRKVRPEWLHSFLLDPHEIRPAAILRMPKFNMSSKEARHIVDYFAAVDRAEYPYEVEPRRNTDYLAAQEAAHAGLYDDALKIVTNGNYCVKCHSVGDYTVAGRATSFGTDKAAAPNLDRVYTRLRSDFTRNWIANPKKLLPYTGMPVNIPPDAPVAQELFAGTSIEQLNGLVDLLMNYDRFAKEKTSIKPLVQAVPAEPVPAEPVPAEPAAGNTSSGAGGE